MNDEISKRLFENGAFCILLDVPVGTEFGIDWNTWTTDTQFKEEIENTPFQEKMIFKRKKNEIPVVKLRGK